MKTKWNAENTFNEYGIRTHQWRKKFYKLLKFSDTRNPGGHHVYENLQRNVRK